MNLNTPLTPTPSHAISVWSIRMNVQFGVWYRLTDSSVYKKIELYHTGARFAIKVMKGWGRVERTMFGELAPKCTRKESLIYYTAKNSAKIDRALEQLVKDLHMPLDAVKY